MSALPSHDFRPFYAALGIELPAWAQENASVRCFADAGAHAREDRRASCSVSLETGAWCCHGCGAHGGAYDAAVARGHDPRSAIDLMITHGLAERRIPTSDRRRARVAATTPAPLAPAPRRAGRPSALLATDADVQRWHQALFSKHGRLLRERLGRERGWSGSVMAELELGHDGQRITIPIRDGHRELTGVLRYRLPGASGPKMLAVPGSRLGLIPHPAHERSNHILLVEGPPDMLAARTRGWPAIAVPGAHAWRAEWAPLLSTRAVTVLMDSDAPGRSAAQRIAADLRSLTAVRVRDLAPTRSDGYDLTDWLLAQTPNRSQRCTSSLLPKLTITP